MLKIILLFKFAVPVLANKVIGGKVVIKKLYLSISGFSVSFKGIVT